MNCNDRQSETTLRLRKGQVFTVVNASGQLRQYRPIEFVGGGATSVVWKVHEVGADGSEEGEPKALKALKSITGVVFQDAFRDEIHVIQALRNAEADLDDGWHAVPALYDVGHSPAYLVMEYIGAPSVVKLALGEGGLREPDALHIGKEVCRVLQLLHSSGRSYKDFQLGNVRWSQEKDHIKVIDWNVVTREGEEPEPEQDLYQLGAYLFWLRALVEPPKAGASPRDLARLGGPSWSDETSLAFRLVVERALHLNPENRYNRACGFPLVDHLKPLSDVQSMGEALHQVSQWGSASPGRLVTLANECKDRRLWSEALAVIELGRRNMDQAPSELSDTFEEALAEIEKEALQSCGRNAFELGQRWLDSKDTSKALRAFRDARELAPDDLEVHRWLSLTTDLKDLRIDRLKRIWDAGRLREAMQDMTEDRWERALRIFRDSHLDLRTLVADAEIHRRLSQAKALWQEMDHSGDAGTAQQLLDVLREIEISTAENRSVLPYLDLILQAWPDLAQWRDWARRSQMRLEDLRKKLANMEREWNSVQLPRSDQIF